MTAKTYGQVLRNELNARVEGLRLSIADTNALEKVAQSVILEFVRRVDERASEILKSQAHYAAWYEEPQEGAFLIAFDQLSAELKEAK